MGLLLRLQFFLICDVDFVILCVVFVILYGRFCHPLRRNDDAHVILSSTWPGRKGRRRWPPLSKLTLKR